MAQVFSCEFYEISKISLFLQYTFGGCFWMNVPWSGLHGKETKLEICFQKFKGSAQAFVILTLLRHGENPGKGKREFMDVLVSLILITWTITWTTCKAFKRRQNVKTQMREPAVRKCSLRELRNRTSRIIRLSSSFCSIRDYASLHFLPILLEN